MAKDRGMNAANNMRQSKSFLECLFHIWAKDSGLPWENIKKNADSWWFSNL